MGTGAGSSPATTGAQHHSSAGILAAPRVYPDRRQPAAMTTSRITADAPFAQAPPSRLRAVVVGSVGNLVEWYDFYCYSAFSLYFANSFFPSQDPTAQMLSTAGIFALGFFIRPVGGWLFGTIGDVLGRR